ncbi:hypothetical protein WJX72_000709 [[Myrmecia] bisecta]|uniref:Phosphoglycerate mutase n=1 Tax=[Myrmecia] bisecta TaxID=41462 RepID=A0AAW1PCW7_9CHLO
MSQHRVVLIRHGESVWNQENRFTGWTDVELSEHGKKEAVQAGQLLAAEEFSFDEAYTSELKRAQHTLQLVVEQLPQKHVTVHHSWQLNERHYGDLQGKNKKETAKEVGEEQVQEWRRGYDLLPHTESLADTVKRVVPYWTDVIAPQIRAGKHVLVAAHGNSLRALAKFLDDISDEDIPDLNIPTGLPLIYELDGDLKAVRHYYIGTKKAMEKKLAFVGSGHACLELARGFIDAEVALADELEYASVGDEHAQQGFQQLGMKTAECTDAVVASSDIIFLTAPSPKELLATLTQLQSAAKQGKILIPVSTEELPMQELEEVAESSQGAAHVVLAILRNKGQDTDECAVTLHGGKHTSEEEVNVVLTLLEAAGHRVLRRPGVVPGNEAA